MPFSWLFARTIGRVRKQARRRRRVPLALEWLEDRITPVALTVTASADTTENFGDETSLRGVINEAESISGNTGAMITINFAVKNITLNRQIDITCPVTINGTGVTITCSNPSGGGGLSFEASGNIITGLSLHGVPGTTIGLSFGDLFGISNGNTVTGANVAGFGGSQIALNYNDNVVQTCMIGTNAAGTAAVGGYVGVAIYGTGNTVGGTSGQGNVISGTTGTYAVFVSGASNNQIEDNYIGTDISGSKPIGNAGSGVGLIDGASDNTVIGNVISDNGHISPTASYAGVDIGVGPSNDNIVQGNLIGTDAKGTGGPGFGNKGDGIDVFGGATGNTIGGSIGAVGKSGGGNLVSNNAIDGISIWDDDSNVTTNNLVEGNLIGTDITGAEDLGNRGNGVSIEDGAANNTVGGTTQDTRNIISGNLRDGVDLGLEPNPSKGEPVAQNNTINGNYIGTDLTGNEPLGNHEVGVYVVGPGNTISANLISDNFGGIELEESMTTNNTVEANFIGTTNAGTGFLSNIGYGVLIGAGASSNTIGGATEAASNVISGNTDGGVILTDPGTTQNVVAANVIGLALDGGAGIANHQGGVLILDGAANNTIGGTTFAAANFISGNSGSGIFIGDMSGKSMATSGNIVEGNRIGTGATSTQIVGNTQDGVQLGTHATNNTIGGTAAGTANVIAGNTGNGVHLTHGATGNVIEGNLIGTDALGMTAVPNTLNGVLLDAGATNNTIGSAAATQNVISGNGMDGVLITGAGTNNNVVVNDFIGVAMSGTAGLPNMSNGVAITAGASSNTIGGSAGGIVDVISDNGANGIDIAGTGTHGNLVERAYIGTDASGFTPIGNALDGVRIESNASANTIGGIAANTPNVISGNHEDGIFLNAGADSNVIGDNLIGFDTLADFVLGNTGRGIEIQDSAENTIGGTATFAYNRIGNNGEDGILIEGVQSTKNVVQGNLIGIGAVGGPAAPNAGSGVVIEAGANHNTIGGSVAGAGNTIVNSGVSGIHISGENTDENAVAGNQIGTDDKNTPGLGNAASGVAIVLGASFNTIGGTTPLAANVISGNGGPGIQIGGNTIQSPFKNLIVGNFIGTDSTGDSALPNRGDGILLEDAADFNGIGNGTAAGRNVISGNTGNGIEINVAEDDATGDLVQGNYIGTNAAGTAALGNGMNGVAFGIGATGETLGGAGGARNIISGNVGAGVEITGGATRIRVVGNEIGTDPSGLASVSNQGDGIEITEVSDNNTIGQPGLGNIIAFNQGAGVHVDGSTGAWITRNSIFSNTTAGIQLTNNGDKNLPAPVLTSTFRTAGSLTLTGTIAGMASKTFTMEVFSNLGTPGQGERYLGTVLITTNAQSKFSGKILIPVPAGSYITATITDANHDTSPFSNTVTA